MNRCICLRGLSPGLNVCDPTPQNPYAKILTPKGDVFGGGALGRGLGPGISALRTESWRSPLPFSPWGTHEPGRTPPDPAGTLILDLLNTSVI